MSHANGHANGHTNGDGAALIARPPIPDRLPPQNLAAEQGVIGSMLLDNSTIDDVLPVLDAGDFYRDSHEILYREIGEQYSASGAVDSITLEDALRRKGQFDRIGGFDYIQECLGSVPHAANAAYYAAIVKAKAVSRRLMEHAHETLRDCYAAETTAEDQVAAAQSRILAIGDDRPGEGAAPAADLAASLLAAIDRMKATGIVPGYRTGWRDVDDMTCGFVGGQLVVLAARPSMGKSAWALQAAASMAELHGLTSLFVSLEMGKAELAGRLLSLISGVDYYRQRDPRRIGRDDIERLGEAQAVLRERAPILVDDTSGATLAKIASAARRHKIRSGAGLVVVDYIQLIDSGETRDSRQEQVAKISRGLKNLARDLDVPVIALSQLNREVEKREDHRPRMADLRESGAIENDADLVLLLHRPEYFDPNDHPGIAEVIVAKNRNGPTGKADLVFHKGCMRFDDMAEAAGPVGDGHPF